MTDTLAYQAHDYRILILDFGSQTTQLIGRRVREAGVYCEIYPYDVSAEEIADFNPQGIILSGGPESVVASEEIAAPQIVFDLAVPILGICYGMQTLVAQLGGAVESSSEREFGYAEVTVSADSVLLQNIEDRINADGQSLLDVWMSHGDRVSKIPDNFCVIANSEHAPYAAIADESRHYYGLQFHPEVVHTKQGEKILARFIHTICQCPSNWTPANIVDESITVIQQQVGKDKVLLGLSGGVDSSVVAALLHKAIGDQLACVFVDTGLLRLNEGDQVRCECYSC